MGAARERLPNRREATTFDLDALGLRYRATVGKYADGRIGEVFITNHKAGSAAGIMASDAAVLCSILRFEPALKPLPFAKQRLMRHLDRAAVGLALADHKPPLVEADQ